MKKKIRLWCKRHLPSIGAIAFIMTLFVVLHCAAIEKATQAAKDKAKADIDLRPITQTNAMMLFDCPLEFDLQQHIIDTCDEYRIAPEIIFAMIDQESDFDASAMGDSGNSYGLMQVQQRYHKDRMQKLGCTDLLDPYQNVQVGIDYLAALKAKYGNTEMALVAYNCGGAGAKENYFDKGQFWSVYSQEVLEQAEEYLRGMIEVEVKA